MGTKRPSQPVTFTIFIITIMKAKRSMTAFISMIALFFALSACGDLDQKINDKMDAINRTVEGLDSLANDKIDRVQQFDTLLNTKMEKLEKMDSLVNRSRARLDSLQILN